MLTWQIEDKNTIKKANAVENLNQVDDVKVKVTKCLITLKDVAVFSGKEKRNLPIVPSTVAVGQIIETLNESNYFTKGKKVFLFPENENDGFLKEFAVVNKERAFVLPENVSEQDAMFIGYVSNALSIIDNLNIKTGDHVAILGGSILGNILAQLLSYYKAVPIILSDNDKEIETALKNNVYYAIKTSKNTEKEFNEITGGEMCDKIVYILDDNLDIDFMLKIGSVGSTILFAGNYIEKQKLSVSEAAKKSFILKFLPYSYENVATAINLLVLKTVNLSNFKLNYYKFAYIDKQFENANNKLLNDQTQVDFAVDLT